MRARLRPLRGASRSATSRSCSCSPLSMIVFRTFQDGLGPVWDALTDPALHPRAPADARRRRDRGAGSTPSSASLCALALVRRDVDRAAPGSSTRRSGCRSRSRRSSSGSRSSSSTDKTAGSGSLARRQRHPDHLLDARDRARDHLRDAAVRRARGHPGAARDRHRPGGGRLDARRLARRPSGASRCRRSAGASRTASS